MNDDDNEHYRPEGVIKWMAGAFVLVLIGCIIVLTMIVVGRI